MPYAHRHWTVRTVALISPTNMTCAAWNKYVHLKEQPKNIWLLSLIRWSWIMLLVSTWLVGPNPIPRACGLVNCLLTVFLYNYSPSRQNSCQTWVNSLAKTFRVRLQGRQMKMLRCNKYFITNKSHPKYLWPWHWACWKNLRKYNNVTLVGVAHVCE